VLDGKTIGIWGLTFKANTDDRRDSPSLRVAHRLKELGAIVQAFDPTVEVPDDKNEEIPTDLVGLELRNDPYLAATNASAVVVLTEWEQFRWVDFGRLLNVMKTPAIIDGRNLLDSGTVRRMGFTYSGIGRP
jgi:UDPglucose 6-dehydrogenase